MTEEQPILCIYHANCADGFGAAWALTKGLAPAAVELHPADYNAPVPADATLVGRDVYLVDFSYPQDVLRRMASVAGSVTIIDHHKTSYEAVQPLLDEGIVQGTFDMTKSGALLTWDWFFGSSGKPAPALIRHISDRDLWEFKLPNTREVVAALFSYPMALEQWDALMERDIGELVLEGTAILRDHDRKIAAFLPKTRQRLTIGGIEVPAANVPSAWASDTGHLLDADAPFAATFWTGPGAINFSLRSRKDGGADVEAIAKRYGGGGHRNAAGFTIRDWSEL